MSCFKAKAVVTAAIAALATFLPSSFAQTASPARMPMVQAGGQRTAYAVRCGKATASQAAEQRTNMREKFLADGMSASACDSAYQAA